MKPNRAAIRNTKSQWPRRDGSEMPVGRVAVPKTGKSIGTLPFLDRSAGHSPREDGPEVLVGKVAVPKTGQKDAWARDNLYPDGTALFPCARKHTSL